MEEPSPSLLPLNPLDGLLSDRVQQVWQSYRSLVKQHRVKLELADDAVDRLLFWVPYHENKQAWREVVYGLLSLNRLAMDCATQESSIDNSHGTTLLLPKQPSIPATSLRIALTVTHCLMPSILEMVSSNSTVSSRRRQQTLARLYLERFKFLLRLVLMVSYWKDSLDQQKKGNNSPILMLGLVTDGGTYNIDQPTIRGLTLDQEQALHKRHAYVGRRTGLSVAIKSKFKSTTTTSPQQQSRSSAVQVVLAELLYILRPLYWASAEATHFPAIDDDDSRPSSSLSSSLLKAWLVTLGMDLTSLGLLVKTDQVQVNPATKAEWNRRRMKLFLYLLRSPIWSQLTAPTVGTCSSVLRHIPLVGGLADSYLWDWILYQKHPYVSEEG
jgi:hypothetical protein